MTHPQEQLLSIYKMMLLIRRFEERTTQYFLSGEIRGSFHPRIGQDASAVRAIFALRRDDYLLCTYSGHGHPLAKGLVAKEAMAELLGKQAGCSKGKGSSRHFTDPRAGLLGENAIVGAGVASTRPSCVSERRAFPSRFRSSSKTSFCPASRMS